MNYGGGSSSNNKKSFEENEANNSSSGGNNNKKMKNIMIYNNEEEISRKRKNSYYHYEIYDLLHNQFMNNDNGEEVKQEEEEEDDYDPLELTLSFYPRSRRRPQLQPPPPSPIPPPSSIPPPSLYDFLSPLQNPLQLSPNHPLFLPLLQPSLTPTPPSSLPLAMSVVVPTEPRSTHPLYLPPSSPPALPPSSLPLTMTEPPPTHLLYLSPPTSPAPSMLAVVPPDPPSTDPLYLPPPPRPPPQSTSVVPTNPSSSRSSPRRNPNQSPRAGKIDTVPIAYPWATNIRAQVHTLEYLESEKITSITGEVQCKRCELMYTISYNLREKFMEIGSFIVKNKSSMHDRAPTDWMSPNLLTCISCGQENSVKPMIPDSKNTINWLFLLLGKMLGCCTLEQLKYFCKHSRNHRTGAKDRVLYLTYLSLCKQLDPKGPFDR